MKAEYVNHSLTDFDVANAARNSFAKLAEHYSADQNASLIKFLARGMAGKDWDALIHEACLMESEEEMHDLLVYVRKIPEHWVPFAHPHITLRMNAPVPIRTQCFKHKIGFVESETSRRYISSKPEIYIPGHFRGKAENVKQGSGDKHYASDYWKQAYTNLCHSAVELYSTMIEDGVCAEQARFALPQGTEVHWVWTGSLYAFAEFYNQRTDPHAQKEVQELAHAVGEIIHPLYPVSWQALTQGDY